jgi:hypothetical protein
MYDEKFLNMRKREYFSRIMRKSLSSKIAFAPDPPSNLESDLFQISQIFVNSV